MSSTFRKMTEEEVDAVARDQGEEDVVLETGEEACVLLVTTAEGMFKLTIPGESEVTYGPLFTSTRQKNAYDRPNPMPACLRVYAKPGRRLRAVFTDVLSFYDLRYSLEKKVASVETQTMWRDEGDGSFSASASGVRHDRWLSEGPATD